MTTPTPIKHAPSQQGRTPSQLPVATPPVSTPFSNAAQHAAFSPLGAKSSPQQIKKSPATSNLMGQSSMGGAFNFDSPSAVAAMGALGIGAGFDMGLDNVGMPVAPSGEDDVAKRLDAIISILQTKGYVSTASLERLAQRLGLELLSEVGSTGSSKTTTLAIAGCAIALEIVLENNIVLSASLTYHGSSPSVSRHIDAASRILVKHLKLAPNQSPLTKTLDSFASNFERLAMLDKLSILPGLDCHEALAGIYDSLERLYAWDMARLRRNAAYATKSEQYISNMAMCAQHGFPVMHARDRVGLALQYWRELRFLPPDALTESYSLQHEKTWSLLIGCAPLSDMSLPPVRVSDNWISKDIVKQPWSMDEQNFVLDWLEPPNLSLPQSDDNKNPGINMLQPDMSTAMMPRVVFTATFDPPIILPQNEWARLFMYAGIPQPNMQLNSRGTPPTYDGLFFPVAADSKVDASEPRSISRQRLVRTYDQDLQPVCNSHINTLYVYKPIYAQVLTEIPFSHPRQLIEMLPVVRQYAFLSRLLENSFGARTAEVSSVVAEPHNHHTAEPASLAKLQGDLDSATDFVKDVLRPDDSSPCSHAQPKKQAPICRVDAILWVHPAPYIHFVLPAVNPTVHITLKILEGGTVEIIDENIAKDVLSRDKLARALEVFEDLNKWAEWLWHRL